MVGFLLLQGAAEGSAMTEGDLLQAEHALETALSLNPRSPEALLGSGLLWLRQGRPDEAIVPLEKAQALHPDDPAISRVLSRCRSLLDHPEGRHSPR
jgi:Flp pilus assembly protein TadD